MVATWAPGTPAETAVIVAFVLLQGLGVGLFQVSYTEVVSALCRRISAASPAAWRC